MAINRIKTGGITDDTIQSGDIAPGTIANDRLAGSIANAKLANSAITINGTSIALGASGEIVAGTDWQAVTVADGSTTLTTEAGKGYFLDTNTGVIEVFLPSSPTRGDTVVLMDYAGTFGTNKVIINTQGQNIDSTTGGFFQLTTNNTVAELIYVDSNTGWFAKLSQAAGTVGSALSGGQLGLVPTFTEATGGTVTTSGDYKIHTFTGDGCFVVTKAGNFGCKGCASSGPNIVDYLVVAGGGGGGGGGTPSGGQGGGGAGGFRESRQTTTPAHTEQSPHTASPLASDCGIAVTLGTTYPITVGAGGSGGPQSSDPYGATNGSPSIFSTITSTGGGQGTGTSYPGGQGNGVPGGSGGGTAYGPHPSTPTTAGQGNQPPVSPPQGNDGGTALYAGPQYGGSGGGGATQAGGNGSGSGSGQGGNGATTHITGSPVAYAGGGGGGQTSGTAACGGTGGGGNGGSPAPAVGTNGSANTGGGGGAGSRQAGAQGGKGIVVLRYKYQ